MPQTHPFTFGKGRKETNSGYSSKVWPPFSLEYGIGTSPQGKGTTTSPPTRYPSTWKFRPQKKKKELHGYRKASFQADDDNTRTMKVEGTISANSLVLNILAYNTSILHPGAAKRAAEEALQDNTQDDTNDDTSDEDMQNENLAIEDGCIDLDDSLDIEDRFVDLDDAEIDDGDIHLDDSQGSDIIGGGSGATCGRNASITFAAT
ncbi:hypothetical protein BGZ54_001188 [Gamsiella multidivaricata]|nr:hypothetical protein BGZ54_001188 [Gamsiella multidivaricata]